MIISDEKLAFFLQDVYTEYGEDFRNYNFSTLKRRINIHSMQLKVYDFESYKSHILNDIIFCDEMSEYFSINVTEFFREPKQLKLFREYVVSYLKSYSHIKIWYAGSSSGESPYSLAIILDEMNLLHKCQIYATDFNNKILSKAKEGFFYIENLQQAKNNYTLSGGKKSFEDYFVKEGKYYKIKNYLKKQVLFFSHNLSIDGVMNKFELIICKNVLIYFNKTLKQNVIQLFDDSLEYHGFLILGENEYLPKKFESSFQKFIPRSKVFQKKCK